MTKAARWSAYAAGGAFTLLLLGALTASLLWQRRPDIESLDWQPVDPDAAPATVSATWFGISTLLFDDGETQVLVDGTFTRLSAFDILTQRKVGSDIGAINFVTDEFRISRLAAIVPVHAHFAHAIDVGNVANRSRAIVLGSESIANIARGARVPVDQYQILADRESRHFGKFTITVIASGHEPIGPGRLAAFAGTITEPLVQPARSAAWRSDTPVTIVIEHPSGSSVVQGSAGVAAGLLANRQADTVFLSVAGLAARGRQHAEQYWNEVVAATGARRVVAVHFDDYTGPLGETRLFPEFVDDVPVAAAWLNEFATQSGVAVERPTFGTPIPLY